MKNILVLMGGVSVEHDISLITAVQTINNIDKSKYAIYPVVIDKLGKWHFSTAFDKVQNITNYFESKKQNNEVILHNKSLYMLVKNKLKKQADIDCTLLCLHGGTGENGAIQGFLEAMGMPFTSPNHIFSAIFMNKSLSKLVFEKLQINHVQGITLEKKSYLESKRKVLEKIKESIPAPYFVKPNSGGSSIGAKLCKTMSQLVKGLDTAFCYDDEVIVERAVSNLYELNIAVTKKEGKVITSMIEKPCNKNKILTFEDKYLSGSKRGMQSMGRQLPAVITKEQEDFVISSATKVYEEFIKQGVVRVDYLVDSVTQEVFINEVNTIPGSMSFYLWEGKMTFSQLIDNLINEAIANKESKIGLLKTFSSSVLANFSGGKTGSKV